MIHAAPVTLAVVVICTTTAFLARCAATMAPVLFP